MVDDLSDLETLYRVGDFVNKLGRQQLNAPLRRLADFMLEYHDTYGEGLRWLFNESERMTAVTNFLRALDIFSQNDSGSCVVQLQLQAYVSNTFKACSSDDATNSNNCLISFARLLGRPISSIFSRI